MGPFSFARQGAAFCGKAVYGRDWVIALDAVAESAESNKAYNSILMLYYPRSCTA
jgi:hypothetical protein